VNQNKWDYVADLATQTEPGNVGFDSLSLSPVMLEALAKAEYLTPTPVQAGLIPRALAGVDVLGQARTGTGKTAAFVIPILERLGEHHRGAGPQALVLVPTRELAVQVRDEAVKLSHGRRLHIVPLYGGKPIRGQIEKLRKGADVVIGTPGRVIDHLGRGTLDLRDLRFVVLDEADRMLDIGFRPDIERILRKCPASRQTLLLSATVPPPVERLAQRYMRDPESLNFSPKDISVETIEQFYFTVDPERKFDLLERLLEREQPRQAIIFCRTKRGTDKVNHRLSRKIKAVGCIHGDLAQNVRDRVMAAFREGKVRYLVATDVVGRGIDVTGISHIINYDIPQFCDDYVHRVGRTGRMGREGVAYTFVSPEEGNELTRIEMRIDRLLTRDEIPGFIAVVERQRDGEAMTNRPNVAPDAAAAASAMDVEAAETLAVKPRPSPPLLGRGGRAPRRIRRAL
jgi:ATP-dependent RNA helicase DeaD